MSASMTTDSDIELFREDLVALKRDVASLIEHAKGGATDTVQDAAGQIKRRVRSLREEAGAQRDRSARAVNLFVENQPVAALSIAVALGYIELPRASAVGAPILSGNDLVALGLASLLAGAAPAEEGSYCGSFRRCSPASPSV